MRHSRILSALVVLTLLAVAIGMAQAPAAPPKPGAEHQRLAYFVGKWSGTADMKASALGPAGKMSWIETCEWFAGNFAIVCHSDWKGPQGDAKGLNIMSYNMEEKAYAYFGVTSIGEVESSKGSVAGKVWTWANDAKVGGKPYKMRYTSTEVSNDVSSFKFEMSSDGGKTWTSVMEGKSTRAK